MAKPRTRKPKARKPRMPRSITVKNPDSALTVLNKLKPRVYTFKRALMDNQITQPAPAGSNYMSGELHYTLASFPGTSEMTALFSKYKITQFEITWRLVNAPPNGKLFPTIYCWKNDDSQTTSFSMNQVSQIANVKMYTLSDEHRSFTMKIRPYIIGSTYNSGFDHINGNEKWIDCDYTAVVYYSFGFAIDDIAGTADYPVQIEYDLSAIIKCKSLF